LNVPRLTTLGLATAATLCFAAAAPPALMSMTRLSAIDAAQAKSAVVWLRTRLEGGAPPLPQALAPFAGDRVPVSVSLWVRGARARTWQINDATLKEALERLGDLLAEMKSMAAGPTARIELSIAAARGRLPDGGLPATYALEQGRDGFGGLVDGRPIFVPPTELIKRGVYGSEELLPGRDLQLNLGSSPARMRKAMGGLAKELGLTSAAAVITARYRTITVIEGADRVPREFLGGTLERPPLTRARLKAAARAGAAYLASMLKMDGTFIYEFDPVEDRPGGGAYSWPRHAGAAYALVNAGRLFNEPAFTSAARDAIGAALAKLNPAPDGSKCLLEGERCYFGSTALLLIAVAEYRLATGDARFDGAGRAMAAFIRGLQRDNGLFYHYWSPKTGLDRGTMLLYASQQGALALAKWGRATNDAAALAAARRGMDYLAGPYWSFFLGKWFYGPEHWTCLAAEELDKVSPNPAYTSICVDIGRHFARSTLHPGDTPFYEHVGGLGLADVMPPHEGGTATGAEAMATAVAVGRASGADVARIREALFDTCQFLTRCQPTVHDAFWMRRPEMGVGGLFERQTVPMIRIDNVQHAISAMMAGIELLPEDPPGTRDAATNDFLNAKPAQRQ